MDDFVHSVTVIFVLVFYLPFQLINEKEWMDLNTIEDRYM